MSDRLADAIEEQAKATREQTELLRQIATALFEIAAQGSEQDVVVEDGDSEESDTYIDGSPKD